MALTRSSLGVARTLFGSLAAVVTFDGIAIALGSLGVLDWEVVLRAIFIGTCVVPTTVGSSLVLILVGFRLARNHAAVLGISVFMLVPGLLGIYARWIEPGWLRVDQVEVGVETTAELRLGVLADLQTNSIGDYERNAVRRLIAETPDVVLIPGDVFQDPSRLNEGQYSDFVGLFRELVEAAGVVVVVEGDHDSIKLLSRLEADTGVILLHHESRTFRLDGGVITIVGVGDRGGLTKSTFAELANPPSENLTIVLAHSPDVIERMPPAVAPDLIVSGHTHGGQVVLPWIGPLINRSNAPDAVAEGGLHRLGEQLLYVSTGVGRQGDPAPRIRFGSRPSVGLLQVHSSL